MDITPGFPEKINEKKYSYKRHFVISQGPGPVNKVERKIGKIPLEIGNPLIIVIKMNT